MRAIKFGDKSSSDVILVVKKQKFFVHKKILAEKSEYFDRMFNGNFKEANQKQITIKDTNPEIFNKILELIYTGKIERAKELEKNGFQCSYTPSEQEDGNGSLSWVAEWPHYGGFTQDFVSNFTELSNTAERFDLATLFVQYVAKEVVEQLKHTQYACMYCGIIDHIKFEMNKRLGYK